MTLKLLIKLVKRNFVALKTLFIPFILTASMMLGLEYILLSIINNDYIAHRHEYLPELLMYINVIIMILSVIFIIYANSFIMKRRRKEYALQIVLGLEKKHLHIVSFLELSVQFIVVSILSIVGGYLFGNLLFLLLNKLISKTSISIMHYPFSIKAMLITLAISAVLFSVLLMINIIHTSTKSPIKLMNESRAGEKKTRKWILIPLCLVGALCLGYGYYLALSAKTIVSSFQTIFTAIFFVMIGTYALFMSLSLLLLQWLQRIPKIYYKPKNFFSIAGLLSRMKVNVVGLASITMLCTFLIVTMGMTVTTYRGLEDQVEQSLKEVYQITLDGNYNYSKKASNRVEALKKDIDHLATVDQYRIFGNEFISFQLKDHTFKVPKEGFNLYMSDLVYGVVVTQKDYNQARHAHVHLKDNEIIIDSDSAMFNGMKHVKVGGKTYNVIRTDNKEIGNQIAADSAYIIVKDDQTFKTITKPFTHQDSTGGTNIDFNIQGNKKSFAKAMAHLQKEHDVSIMSKDGIRKSLYELNGGLIFMGIVVSIVLLVGTFLMLYNKQISEGYEDKRNFDIMQKVGLDYRLIKQTIHQQIMWVFVLPILVALIHTLFAGKIIYKLLGVLGIKDLSLFLSSYVGVTFIVVLVYGFMYWITSTIYYKIVQLK
ncbi:MULTISPECIES: FtsX-like permease family protein [Staphylococcus]|uniref:FtsX-like permease family protein n=1 Tax=Staphylococcus agnetis TaxID=985762 RepID=A0AAW9YTP2_9STAP|nr:MULTISPECIES: FtsX-like permease family protein [Staphylococcus]NHM92658.1 FtsX-like permease family protein [Staphylococcus sp. 10602379]NJI02150.1 FtsX-like permease family protein [Staphylococcus agnetis]